jgi:hypothetical protein
MWPRNWASTTCTPACTSSGCRRGTSLRERGRARRSRQDETDKRVLWKQDAQRVNGLYDEALNRHRAAIGLPPVDNVRDYVLTDQPWLAADAALCPSQVMTARIWGWRSGSLSTARA